MKQMLKTLSILTLFTLFKFSEPGVGILGLGKQRGIDTAILGNQTNEFTRLTNLLVKGVQVDSLIDRKSLEQVLAIPYNPNISNLECLLPNLNKSSSTNTTARWYRNPNPLKGRYWFIPVVLETGFSKDESNIIYTGMIEIQQSSCIDFYIYSKESDLRGFDYVKITREKNNGCFSNALGRLHRGKQQINLEPKDSHGRTCIARGIVVHELLHIIGFAHQQNAPERDDYITILWDNLPNSDNIRYQFMKLPISTSTSYGAKYDYASVMHYGRKDFTKNGNDTIVPKGRGKIIGQRRGLSKLDAYKVNQMYECGMK